VLILVTKVLQNMANDVRFGSKERYMIPLNAFLDANAASVQAYLASFAVPPVSAAKRITLLARR